jgi:acyl carrier protein
MGNLKEQLKKEIVEVLNLEDLKPSDIGDEDALFGEKIGLDSIDALELIVLLEKNYGRKIDNPEDGKKIFQSVNSICEFIESKR